MSIWDLFKNKELSMANFNKQAIGNYYRTYLFKVIIEGGGTKTAMEWIATTATPHMTTTIQNVDYMHTQIRQAGRITPNQWTVTVRDDAESDAFMYFNNWRNDIYPLITGTTPQRYKRSADLILLPPDQDSRERKYTLHGVWPFELGSVQLDYDQENIAVFPVTLSFDFFTAG